MHICTHVNAFMRALYMYAYIFAQIHVNSDDIIWESRSLWLLQRHKLVVCVFIFSFFIFFFFRFNSIHRKNSKSGKLIFPLLHKQLLFHCILLCIEQFDVNSWKINNACSSKSKRLLRSLANFNQDLIFIWYLRKEKCKKYDVIYSSNLTQLTNWCETN